MVFRLYDSFHVEGLFIPIPNSEGAKSQEPFCRRTVVKVVRAGRQVLVVAAGIMVVVVRFQIRRP